MTRYVYPPSPEDRALAILFAGRLRGDSGEYVEANSDRCTVDGNWSINALRNVFSDPRLLPDDVLDKLLHWAALNPAVVLAEGDRRIVRGQARQAVLTGPKS